MTDPAARGNYSVVPGIRKQAQAIIDAVLSGSSSVSKAALANPK
jgi:hypothetical protein